MKIFCDIDNTLCFTQGNDYALSKPWPEKIAKINKLFDEGNEITIWTSRGNTSGLDHYNLTVEQLQRWGVKYHKLMMGKPSFDRFYDDKSYRL